MEVASDFEKERYNFLQQELTKTKEHDMQSETLDFDVDYEINFERPKVATPHNSAGRRPFCFWPTFRAFLMDRFMRVGRFGCRCLLHTHTKPNIC